MKYVWDNVDKMRQVPLVVRDADALHRLGRIIHEAYQLALREVDEFRNSMDLLSTAVRGTTNNKTQRGLYMEMKID